MKNDLSEKTAVYAIIGNGRVAKNISRYFSLIKIPYKHWHRKIKKPLEESIKNCKTVLLLIKDSVIEPFIKKNPFLSKKKLVHFSGSLVTPLAYGVHPLYSFTHRTLTLREYKKIPFITEKCKYKFTDIFPKLKNPHYEISAQSKPLYHALCVMSGNFSTVLWQKLFDKLENTFEIPKKAAYPYLNAINKNLLSDYKTAFAGPFLRKDFKTIKSNLNSLKKDPFRKIYYAFVKTLNIK